MSEIHKNISDETRKKMRQNGLGRKLSPEAIEKIRLANTGRKHSLETRKKISDAQKDRLHPMLGKHHSETTKIKISESKKGKQTGEKNPFYGKKHSAESIEKMKASHKKVALAKRKENDEFLLRSLHTDDEAHRDVSVVVGMFGQNETSPQS